MSFKKKQASNKSIAKPVSYWLNILPDDLESFKKLNPGMSVAAAATQASRGLSETPFGQAMNKLSSTAPYDNQYIVWPTGENVLTTKAPATDLTAIGGTGAKRLGIIRGAKHADRYAVTEDGSAIDVGNVSLLYNQPVRPGFDASQVATMSHMSYNVTSLVDTVKSGPIYIAAMDTETSGFDSNDMDEKVAAELTQVTALIIKVSYDEKSNRVITEYVDYLDEAIRPLYPVSKKIMKMTNKTTEGIAASEEASVVLPRITEFLKKNNVTHAVFHNASFDTGQLDANHFDFADIKIIDTLKTARSAKFKKEHKSVGALSRPGSNAQIQLLMRIFNITVEKYGDRQPIKKVDDTLQGRLNHLCHDSMVDTLFLSQVFSGLLAAAMDADSFSMDLPVDGPVASVISDTDRLGDKVVAIMRTLFYSGDVNITTDPQPGVEQLVRDIIDGYAVAVPESNQSRSFNNLNQGISTSNNSSPETKEGASERSFNELDKGAAPVSATASADLPDALKGIGTGL